MLVRSVALAMAAAHRLGVIHRDLKPANIIVTPGGEPVVADFGIALLLDPEAPRMTDPGAMMGTLPYMGPEQLRGDPEAIGPASDVYSLGVVLYELLAGKLPYKNPIVEVLLEPSRHPAAAPPSAHKPGGDAALDADLPEGPGPGYPRALPRHGGVRRRPRCLPGHRAGPPHHGRLRPRTDATRGTGRGSSPALIREAIRFAFVGHGEQVPAGGPPPDRLYLDVGNDRRAGVIDHHQVESSYDGCTARLVLAHPDLVDGRGRPRARSRDVPSPSSCTSSPTSTASPRPTWPSPG